MKISIIGAASYVGSNVALTLAANGLSDEIILIDPCHQNTVMHLAMDINTAAAEKSITVRAGEYPDIKDSHIVIVTAGTAPGFVSSRLEMLPKNLPIIRDIASEIKEHSPNAIIITATDPVDALNYAMFRYSGFDRHKLIGYSTNDSIRFRMMVAQELGHKFTDVEGFTVGEHGESQALLFSSLKIKGKPVKIDITIKEKIRSQFPNIRRGYEELETGRTTGITSAVGMKKVVESIVNNTNEVISCSAILYGEYGLYNLSMGVPAMLGRGGIYNILEMELAPDEQPYLTATLDVLKAAMQQVDNYLGVPFKLSEN